jgi:signal transduction histidine kinase
MPDDLRILIFAPVGRTAALAGAALERAGFACRVCGAMRELCEEISRGAGAVLLLEEAIAPAGDARLLARTLGTQPAWSDLPITVLVSDPAPAAELFRMLEKLGEGRSVLVLARPIRRHALISVMTASLRNRERQYRLRDLIVELRDARRTAEEANRAKTEFLGVMSHELRTPLNAIIGFGDLLHSGVSGPLAEAQQVHVERIRKSATHLRGLIEDLLAFSRLEVGREEVHLVRADATELAREAMELVEGQAAEKGLALRVSLPDGSLEIETDPRKLRQILLNLLGNAIKFTDDGSIELAVAASGAAWVLFQVHDTGSGIAPQDYARIFEPFEQVDASLTRRGEGAGLGLGVSRKLAHVLGGELSVESRLGRGSTFTLRLPRRGGATAAPPV